MECSSTCLQTLVELTHVQIVYEFFIQLLTVIPWTPPPMEQWTHPLELPLI